MAIQNRGESPIRSFDNRNPAHSGAKPERGPAQLAFGCLLRQCVHHHTCVPVGNSTLIHGRKCPTNTTSWQFAGIAWALSSRHGVLGHRDDALLLHFEHSLVSGLSEGVLWLGGERSKRHHVCVHDYPDVRRQYVRNAVVMKVVLGWKLDFQHRGFLVEGRGVRGCRGLFSPIFNEVLQFFLVWFGKLLIPILGLIEAGGWSGMVARIHQNFPGQDSSHLWGPMNFIQQQSYGCALGRRWVRVGRSHFHGLLDDRFPGCATRAFCA